MKKIALLILFITSIAHNTMYARTFPPGREDTLPNFLLKNAGNNRIIIGWVNNYPNVKQISIQRSFDSLTNFKTILTVPDPTTVQNGYMDVKAINDHMFYRLYILLDKGDYVFTEVKRPVADTIRKTDPAFIKEPVLIEENSVTAKPDTIMVNGKPVIVSAHPVVIKIDSLHWNNSTAIPNTDYNKAQPNAFTPSLHVFTSRDGYVRIILPDDDKPKKYSIKFFDDMDVFLFELKDIKEKDFKIDKTNFYHAGWFRFELYEDGKLLEKHKLYLEKDF